MNRRLRFLDIGEIRFEDEPEDCDDLAVAVIEDPQNYNLAWEMVRAYNATLEQS